MKLYLFLTLFLPLILSQEEAFFIQEIAPPPTFKDLLSTLQIPTHLELKIGINYAIQIGNLVNETFANSTVKLSLWSSAPYFEYNENTGTLMFIKITEKYQNRTHMVYVNIQSGQQSAVVTIETHVEGVYQKPADIWVEWGIHEISNTGEVMIQFKPVFLTEFFKKVELSIPDVEGNVKYSVVQIDENSVKVQLDINEPEILQQNDQLMIVVREDYEYTDEQNQTYRLKIGQSSSLQIPYLGENKYDQIVSALQAIVRVNIIIMRVVISGTLIIHLVLQVHLNPLILLALERNLGYYGN
ncbi:hypothetical protein FGO68_gene4192 [Halteria grandinella]|uniref:Uncharacterized protein n=1 Tax=Halteria grandinella TaxID=5974 RepID=A0A8J8NDU0_HALGN|nr:hypothetical protein FGO68_gene4192 [Halteria grandinella]